MRNFITILITSLLCLNVFDGYAQEEELKQILSLQNLSASGNVDIFSTQDKSHNVPRFEDNNLIGLFSDNNYEFGHGISLKAKKQDKFITYNVLFYLLEGYTFHVADYSDGTRVVTALDGEMMGYQAVAVNGIQVGGSSSVTWYKDYFVHKYPNGKITSYDTKQVAELK